VLERLQRGDPHTFDAPEDRECLREAEAIFRPHREQIVPPGRTWVIQQARLSPGNPPLSLGPGKRVTVVRWAWRPGQGVTQCPLAVDPKRFFATPAEAPRAAPIRWEDFRRSAGSVTIPVPPGARQLFVTVWPLLDLGWVTLAG